MKEHLIHGPIIGSEIDPQNGTPGITIIGLRHLSARELHVATAVADGTSNAEIAADLILTVPTVKGYISTIFSEYRA